MFWPDSFLKAFIIWNWTASRQELNVDLEYFIPRREMRSISCRGPIETLSIYCCLSKRILHFEKPEGFLNIFEPRKCFLWRMDGWDGLDGPQKCPLIFFILRYIKHYTHIYLYTNEKLSGQISCGFIFWSSWGVAPTIFKITLLRRHFSKMSLKVDFLEKSHRSSVILKIVGATLQLVQNLTPIRNLLCTFLYLCCCYP